MKSFTLVLFVAQAVILQSAYSQVIRSSQIAVSRPIVGPVLPSCGCSPSILPAPVLAPSCGCSSPIISAPVVSTIASPVVVPSVANSLADTLSLLTVSSLLADTLPLSLPSVVSTVPVVGGCGCGGYGYSLF